MSREHRNLRRFIREEIGQTTVEYMLVLAVFALPMIYLLAVLLSMLAEHYRMVTFIETLPFP